MKKNKIVFVTDEFNVASGVTTYLLILFESLLEEFDIFLITSQGTAIGLLKKYKIKYLLWDSMNFEKKSFCKFTATVIKLGLFLRKNDIKLVHSQDHYSSNIAAYSKFFKKTNHIRTIHSWSNNSGFLNKVAGDYFICVNYHVYKNVIEKNILEKDSVVIMNGITFGNEFLIRKKRANPKTNLLVVSRIVFEKGIQNVLKAIKTLPDSYKNQITLHVAGDGNYKEELFEISKNIGINVKFLGEIIDVYREYLESDIFLLASFREQMPYSLIEAAKYGCFVITSNFDGIEYIFENDVDGFMYEKDSYLDLSKKIKKAIDLGKERNNYAFRFYDKCKEQYNSELMVSKTKEVYYKFI